jgi:hypothetical protein
MNDLAKWLERALSQEAQAWPSTAATKALRRATVLIAKTILRLPIRASEDDNMGACVFICPTTKLNVQHWLEDDKDVTENEYKGVTCKACARVHLINRKTGRLLDEVDLRDFNPAKKNS